MSLNVKCHTNRKQCKLKFHIKKRRKKSIFEGPLLLQVFVNRQLFFSTQLGEVILGDRLVDLILAFSQEY